MHIQVKARYVIAVIAGWFLIGSLSGCVSSSKYKKLQDESSQQTQQISSLQGQVTALQQEKDDLAKSKEKTESAYGSIVNELADEVKKGDLKITQYENMLNVDIADQIFFGSGSAKLKTGGEEVLKKLAKALANYPDKIVWVVGHTDNVPVSKVTQQTYPSNWELSVIRATNVVRYMQSTGVLPGLLIASGRSEFAPVGDNKTPEGRQQNRRIEIKLVDKSLLDNLAQTKR